MSPLLYLFVVGPSPPSAAPNEAAVSAGAQGPRASGSETTRISTQRGPELVPPLQPPRSPTPGSAGKQLLPGRQAGAQPGLHLDSRRLSPHSCLRWEMINGCVFSFVEFIGVTGLTKL